MVLKPLLVVLHHLNLVPGLATVQEVDLGHPVLEHKVTLGAALLRAGEASVLAQANVVHLHQTGRGPAAVAHVSGRSDSWKGRQWSVFT